MPGDVVLSVHDVAGRRVRTLLDEHLEDGMHHVNWNGRDTVGRQLASGVYFYRLEAGAYSETKKMVLVK